MFIRGKLSNQQLIPNQTVSLKVLKSMRENALRIKSNNKIKANTEQTVYLIDNLGNKVSRTVNFGIKESIFRK